jgi:hypothetical protein
MPSAPAARYAVARSTVSSSPPTPVRNVSMRAFRNSPGAAARAVAIRSGSAVAPSSMLTPTAPAACTRRTVSATSPYPFSMSAVTGTDTTAVIRATAATAADTSRASPSGAPRLQATPALVVATAAAPAASTRRALAASQAFTRISGLPGTCRSRKSVMRPVSAWADRSR